MTTEYVYDDAGHLVGEYPSGPNAVSGTTEVLWLGDTPIAVLKRRPGSTNGGPGGAGSATPWQGTPAGGVEVFYLHPDHLDSPRVLVNAANQLVWRWDSAPFGDTDANEQPTAGLPSFAFSLRFPGQQYDQETGTHYNYFRDYEPGVGRYVQSDPVGLAGGLNSFLYVLAMPTSREDAFGLYSPHFIIRPPYRFDPTPRYPPSYYFFKRCPELEAKVGFSGTLAFVVGISASFGPKYNSSSGLCGWAEFCVLIGGIGEGSVEVVGGASLKWKEKGGLFGIPGLSIGVTGTLKALAGLSGTLEGNDGEFSADLGAGLGAGSFAGVVICYEGDTCR